MPTNLTLVTTTNNHRLTLITQLQKRGFGQSIEKYVDTLDQSGLSPTMITQVLDVMQPVKSGRGNATKVKFFTAAIVKHFGEQLDCARNHYGIFNKIISDIDAINDLHESLKGEEVSVSFMEACILYRHGYNTEGYMDLINLVDLYPGRAKKRIFLAIKEVEAGHASSIEGCLNFNRTIDTTEEED